MKFPDRVQETSITVGTGAFMLSGAAEGMVRFSDKVVIGVPVPYCAVMGAQWEVGIGALTSAAALSRTTVLASSNAGAKVDFSVGTKDVFSTVPGALLEKFASSDAEVTTNVSTPATFKLAAFDANGVPQQISVSDLIESMGLALGDLPLAVALADSHLMPISQDGGTSEARVSLSTLKAYFTNGTAPADTTVPTFATGAALTSSNVTQTSFTLTGAAATDNVGVARYEYSLDGGATWTNNNLSLTANITGRTAGTTYPCRFRALDAAGNGSAQLSASVVTSAAAGDTTAPSMSGSITVSEITSSGYTFAWPAGSDNVAVDHYETSIDGGTTFTTSALNLSRVVTGRPASTTDNLRVRAHDAAGLTSNVLTATATTAAPALTTYTYTRVNGAPVPATGAQLNRTNGGFTTGGAGTYAYFSPPGVGMEGSAGYIGLSPKPAGNVYIGWGRSNTTPPPQVADTTSYTSSTNKVSTGTLILAQGGAEFTNGKYYQHGGYFWILDQPGVTEWYYWIKAADGAPYCLNPNSPCVVTL